MNSKRIVLTGVSRGLGLAMTDCATKWAIEGLSQSLAEELPPGLAVVALNPGIIDTAMLRSCWGDDAGAYPDAAAWARRAVPYLLQLGPSDNGAPREVPDE
jgi:NAD(P)-dependent dehydrogenase (short-subunit alcohol dehydrogenase family)